MLGRVACGSGRRPTLIHGAPPLMPPGAGTATQPPFLALRCRLIDFPAALAGRDRKGPTLPVIRYCHRDCDDHMSWCCHTAAIVQQPGQQQPWTLLPMPLALLQVPLRGGQLLLLSASTPPRNGWYVIVGCGSGLYGTVLLGAAS